MAEQDPVVVVGGGLAGGKAVETLRGEGFDGDVVLLTEEPERPYERPPLSKDYLSGSKERDTVFVHDAGWYPGHDVDLRTGVRAVGLDPGAHEVELEGGERLRYRSLLLATGAAPRRLRVPGADLDGVLALRTAADADRLKAELSSGDRQVVVVGAGWIGLEVAAAARSYGNAVTVVEPQPAPLRAVLGDEIGGVFAQLHRDHGVDLRLSTGVSAFRGDGRVRAVVTGAGELPADLVVVGVGVIPRTELAEQAGLDVDDGVVVDAALRTSAPDVWAAGDIASWPHPRYGRRIRVEHWANALNGGPAAARSVLGQEVVHDRLPYFFTDQYDLGMEYSGLASPGDDVVCRGDVAGREFVAFWLDGDQRVQAAMNVNVWDVTDDLQALVRSAAPVDPARLADPDVPFGDLLPRA